MDKLPYEVVCDELPEKMIIRFSGQLIINFIESITASVKEKVNTSKNLEIQVAQPDSIDVTFIQLLEALKNTYQSAGKEVSVSAQLKDELSTLIENSGFNYVLN